MKHFFIALAFSGIALAENHLGLSLRKDDEHPFPSGVCAIRHHADSKQNVSSTNPQELRIHAVISADSILKKSAKTTEAWQEFFTTQKNSEYGKQVSYWEILPPAGLNLNLPDTSFKYSQILIAAKKATKSTHSKLPLGISIPNFDLAFLDSCLRDGAEGQFDFISLSPFPVTSDSPILLPQLLAALKSLLSDYAIDVEIPIFMTLTGKEVDLIPSAAQAQKAGFKTVFIESETGILQKITEFVHDGKATDFSKAASVSNFQGQTNRHEGLFQILSQDTPWDPELKACRLFVNHSIFPNSCRFLIDASFLTQKQNYYEITVESKRLPSPDGLLNPTAFTLQYESKYGLKNTEPWVVEGDNSWHSHTWKIDDAHFKAKLGWHFSLGIAGTGNDALIRKVTIKR